MIFAAFALWCALMSPGFLASKKAFTKLSLMMHIWELNTLSRSISLQEPKRHHALFWGWKQTGLARVLRESLSHNTADRSLFELTLRVRDECERSEVRCREGLSGRGIGPWPTVNTDQQEVSVISSASASAHLHITDKCGLTTAWLLDSGWTLLTLSGWVIL